MKHLNKTDKKKTGNTQTETQIIFWIVNFDWEELWIVLWIWDGEVWMDQNAWLEGIECDVM